LKEYFQYDNTKFNKDLTKRSFFIAKKSNSNYNITWASLLSFFEMSYILNYEKTIFKNAGIYSKLMDGIKENNLIKFLKNEGYYIVNNSFFEMENTTNNPHLQFDVKKRILDLKTLGYYLLDGPLNHIPSNKIQIALNTKLAKVYVYNDYAIKYTKEYINISKKPKFIYTHLMMPHLPYFKDRNGTIRKFSEAYKELRRKEALSSYIEYLQYTNKFILQITDSILQKKENCIIVLASDHGYRWHLKNHRIKNDFNNFIAIYNSDHNYKGLSDTINNVNLFRLILNNNFNQKFPLLKNKCINLREGHF
ncbi:MAG: sulfatase-like hydrolase/transferase, partial [Bacteroidota bacterium]